MDIATLCSKYVVTVGHWSGGAGSNALFFPFLLFLLYFMQNERKKEHFIHFNRGKKMQKKVIKTILKICSAKLEGC